MTTYFVFDADNYENKIYSVPNGERKALLSYRRVNVPDRAGLMTQEDIALDMALSMIAVDGYRDVADIDKHCPICSKTPI